MNHALHRRRTDSLLLRRASPARARRAASGCVRAVPRALRGHCRQPGARRDSGNARARGSVRPGSLAADPSSTPRAGSAVVGRVDAASPAGVGRRRGGAGAGGVHRRAHLAGRRAPVQPTVAVDSNRRSEQTPASASSRGHRRSPRTVRTGAPRFRQRVRHRRPAGRCDLTAAGGGGSDFCEPALSRCVHCRR